MTPAHNAQLQDLRQQIGALQGGLVPRAAALRDQARPQLQRLMSYAQTAAQYAPEVSALLDDFLKRRGHGRYSGLTAKLVRHRVMLTGLLIGAGLFAYDTWGDKLTTLLRDNGPEA